MAYPCSALQKTILAIATRNRGRPRRAADCLFREVLSSHFGWEEESSFGGWRFSYAEIGPAAYRSAMASVSRSFTRLETRGLVRGVRRGSRRIGVSLTRAGTREAQRLLKEEPRLLRVSA